VGQTPGDGETGGIRASDAERDECVERLRDAAGEGRLTLEEFSDRMEEASTAKTRAELDRLVTDLPASTATGGTATVRSSGAPTWHVSPIGGLSVSGPWRMGRHVVVISLIGGADVDLTQAELAARDVTLTKVSIIGGVRARIPNGIRVDASGLSLLGGTAVEGAPDPGAGAPTIHIRAFAVIGGIRIRRGSGRRLRGGQGWNRPALVDGWQARGDDRQARIEAQRARHDERRARRDDRRRGRW
jgi:hypothetical protein